MSDQETPFWERKRLHELTLEEWESLCDGCGRCCLHKLEDMDTGELAYTRVACRLLDCESCQCTDYPNRNKHVPDCISLTPEGAAQFRWLPSTCAYRRLAEGKTLDWWHPLVSGSTETVHQAGVSVRGLAVTEKLVRPTDLDAFIIDPEIADPDIE
ncbi:YcgN family cysteine cluster protein [Alkalilimnicola ehrlichii]|uniref:YcgN family cysteine cluster protein n=1 Tax=Alkalilimnicola ehrlichii TaxID=351052 RepID=UPI002162A9C3|nr:YcgN family cysteine cluster protein [Alkalilimnicola ehrlichii]